MLFSNDFRSKSGGRECVHSLGYIGNPIDQEQHPVRVQ